MIKNIITDFCKERLNNDFINLLYNYFLIMQLFLVRLLGFEPRTSWSVAKRSIQLSYRRKIYLYHNLQIIIEENLNTTKIILNAFTFKKNY